MKEASHMEVWHKLWCPHCTSICWVNLGDMTDLTAADVDVGRCWKCQEVFALSLADCTDKWQYEYDGPEGQYKTLEDFLTNVAIIDNTKQTP
jgi:hypothetical protein